MDFVNHKLEMYLLRLFFGFSYFFYIDALNIPFVSTMFTLKFSSGRGEVYLVLEGVRLAQLGNSNVHQCSFIQVKAFAICEFE